MTDATPTAGSSAPPAGGDATPPGGGTGGAPAAPSRPDWLPEAHWDAKDGIKPEFGTHYAEIAKFHQTETEKAAALAARKPEDIKIELKLPETVKVPEGIKLEINEKDPRVPVIREMAIKHGWTQEQVNDLVAFDAQQQIAAHAAEQARLADERKKLGANADDRIKAAASWIKGLGASADELNEIQVLTATAAGVSLLEKLMTKANGAVPGAQVDPPAPRPEPKSHAERIWPNGFQKKVS
jgi:hypothetical protein